MKAERLDIEVLEDLVHIYCQEIHQTHDKMSVKPGRKGKELSLCHQCSLLLSVAAGKRRECTDYERKICCNCRDHCFDGALKEKIDEIIGFSSKRYIFQGGALKSAHFMLRYRAKGKIESLLSKL